MCMSYKFICVCILTLIRITVNFFIKEPCMTTLVEKYGHILPEIEHMAIYGLKNIAMRNMAMYCNTKFEKIWQYLYWFVYQCIF